MATDWQQIFTARPDLTPPGFQECLDKMRNDPNPRRHKKARGKAGKQGKFPGLKHGVDP